MPRFWKSMKERIEDLRRVVKTGLDSVDKIAEEVGLAKSTFQQYCKYAGIQFIKIKHEAKSRAIEQALANKINSLEELCKISGFKNSGGLLRHCEKNNIRLPKNLIPYRQRPELDVLIDKGATLVEIGTCVGLEGERVRQYINESGQYNEYRQKREEVKNKSKLEKEEKQNLQRIVISLLKIRTKQLSEKEWACQKAVEYFLSRKIATGDNLIPFSKLYNLFQYYEKAMKENKKLSLEELGEKADIAVMTVSNILDRVGIEPMYGRNIETIRKKEKWEATKRGFETIFNSYDIAYFLHLPKHLPGLMYEQIGFHTRKIHSPAQLGYSRLTYRLASKIYEAKDCGFEMNEIAELADTTDDMVDYALFLRNEAEPKIIKGLKILYADKTITKPYVTKDMREKLEKENKR